MILAIVGSVKIDEEQTEVAKHIIKNSIHSLGPDSIVSGGALGVDTIAECVANVLKIEFKKFLPRHRRWEPEGYKERNLLIAQHCDALLCIRTKQSTTYGSGWTADAAEKLGKNVFRYLI